MDLIQYRQALAVVRLPADAEYPAWADGGPISSITRTSDEISVICPTSSLPDDVPGEISSPYTVVRVAGTLELSQVGIMVKLLKPLADAGIPVFTISTFDTDWVLVRAMDTAAAASVWKAAGYSVVEGDE